MTPTTGRKPGAPPGNLNALKHGLYAKHFTPEMLPELKNMPPDDYRMELAASRATLAKALDIFFNCIDEDRQIKLFNACVVALKSIINTIHKLQLTSGDAPEIKDLWEALKEARRLEKISRDL